VVTVLAALTLITHGAAQGYASFQQVGPASPAARQPTGTAL